MQQAFNYSKKDTLYRASEQGSTLVFVLFLIIFFLSMAAIVVDLGMKSRIESQVEKAASAATTSALLHRLHYGWTAINKPEALPETLPPSAIEDKQGRKLLVSEAYWTAKINLKLADLIQTEDKTIQYLYPERIDPSNSCERLILGLNDRRESAGKEPMTDYSCMVVDMINQSGELAAKILTFYQGDEDESVRVAIARPYRPFFAAIFPDYIYSAEDPDVVEQALNSPSSFAQLNRATVALMLDASGSMNCPATGDCTCRKIPGAAGGSCLAEESREKQLRIAAREFAYMFNPYKDKISVTAFRNRAAVAYAAATICDGDEAKFLGYCHTTLGDVIEKSDFLDADGGTNISDAFQHAYEDLSLLPDTLQEGARGDIFWVLFSDGAPTAGRFEFPADTARRLTLVVNGEEVFPVPFACLDTGEFDLPGGLSLECLPDNPIDSGRYDYYHYKVEWPVSDTAYSGPGVLIRASDMNLGDGTRYATEEELNEVCQFDLNFNTLFLGSQCLAVCLGADPLSSSLFPAELVGTDQRIIDAYVRAVRLSAEECRRPIIGNEEPRQWLPYNYTLADPIDGPYPLLDLAVPGCSDLQRVGSQPGQERTDAVDNALGNCVLRFQSVLPNGIVFGSPTNALPEVEQWELHYYHAAIAWSDFVRTFANEERVSQVYTIGLGRPIESDCSLSDQREIPTSLSAISDPYQCTSAGGLSGTAADDVAEFLNMARKDVFLTRIAKDTKKMKLDTAPDSGERFPAFPMTNYTGGTRCFAAELRAAPNGGKTPFCTEIGTDSDNDPNDEVVPFDRNSSVGEYLYTNSAQDLRGLFTNVGKKIMLRLLPEEMAATKK